VSGWPRSRLRRAAAAILRSALDAASPALLVQSAVHRRGSLVRLGPVTHRIGGGRLVLVAVGKAAVPMAKAARAILGSAIEAALVVDPDSAGHPLPDRRGQQAAERVTRLASTLGARDTLLLLLSGGASALLPAPVAGVTLRDKARVTDALLRAGAPIGELNVVRRHLSRLKGGGLARLAAPARVVCLALSDVPGDAPHDIGSGPVSPDPTTHGDALRILAARGVLARTPRSVVRHLESGDAGRSPETLKPGDAVLRRVVFETGGGTRRSVLAAAARARALGLRTLVLTTCLEGEAKEAARVLCSILRECSASGRPAAPPVCLLAGGETTVRVRGKGRGGRNQEMAVAAAAALDGLQHQAVAAFLATDGQDGTSGAAGGVVDDRTLARARALGLAPPDAFLAHNDSHAFLGPLGAAIVTGRTLTNVADLAVLLCGNRVTARAL
jgi:glycerate 2-kinase